MAVWSAAEPAATTSLSQSDACGRARAADGAVAVPAEQSTLRQPLYLRVERVAEYALASREQAGDGSTSARTKLLDGFDAAAPIDRPTLVEGQAQGLVHSLLRSHGRRVAGLLSLTRIGGVEGAGLENFATWAALANIMGRGFPSGSRRTASVRIRRPSRGSTMIMHPEIEFECWLQWLTDRQLAPARSTGRRAGMGWASWRTWRSACIRPGRTHEEHAGPLRRAWRWERPPIRTNRNGQGRNWTQPPGGRNGSPRRPPTAPSGRWSPPSCGMRAASGVDPCDRVFRLWWIHCTVLTRPRTSFGTDQEAMIGILALESSTGPKRWWSGKISGTDGTLGYSGLPSPR